MHKLSVLAVTASVAVASLLGPASTAHASASGFDVSRDAVAVTYDGCRGYAVSYSVPAGIHAGNDWVLTVATHDPAGALLDRRSISSVDGIPANGTVDVLLCDDARPGTYRLESTLDYYNWLGFHTLDHDTDTFTAREPGSTTSLRVNDSTAAYGQRLRFTAHAGKETPAGVVAHRGATVRLEKYVAGSWRVVGTTTTDSYGNARFSTVWKHRKAVPVRAVTLPSGGLAGSTSGERTIY
jgi:hypothetical protein